MTQLLIHPTSRSIRAFTNPDLAYRWARGREDLLYTCPEDLKDLPLNWYSHYREKLGEDKSLWWKALLHYADHVTVMPPWESVGRSDLYHIDLERCKYLSTQMHWGKPRKPPRQLRGIIDLFIAQDAMLYTEAEMKEYMTSTKATVRFNTKQSPWRVFRYYRENLKQLGVMRYD